MAHTSLIGLLVLSTGILAGCADLHGAGIVTCTLIGCDDGITANFPGIMTAYADALPLAIEVCLDERCVSATAQLWSSGVEGCGSSEQGAPCCSFNPAAPDFACDAVMGDVRIVLPVSASASPGASHTVHVKVRGKSGEVLMDADQKVTLAAFQPNGPDCAPICYQGGADFTSTAP